MIASPKKIIEEMKLVRKLRNAYKARYHEIGIGRIVGIILFLMYFTVWPALFKKIWPYLLANYEVVTIYWSGLFGANLGVFIVYNSILYVIYMLNHPFFEQYKNSNKPWPWDQNPEEWKKLKIKSAIVLAINLLVMTPFTIYMSTRSTIPFDFSLENWPSIFELSWQFIVFLLVQDFLFYTNHRILHHPKLYWAHKIHHEHRQSISISSHCMHPVDFLIAGALPSTLGFTFLSSLARIHFVTVILWTIFRMIHGYELHCGYTWTWSTQSLLPYTVGPDNHDFHHSMNAGNYGSIFIFWDAFFQTQTPFVKYLASEVEKKNTEEEKTK